MTLKELPLGAFFVFNGMRLLKTDKTTDGKWRYTVSSKGTVIYIHEDTEVEEITIDEWRRNDS
jgi:hypothetical protein